MSSNVVHLTPLRQRIVEALVAGRRVTDIAANLGCDRASVWRTKRDPAVALLLTTRTSDRLADAMAARDEDCVEAMEWLGDVACGRVKNPDPMRLQAVRELIARSPLATIAPPGVEERAREAMAAAAGGLEAVDALVRRRAGEALGFGAALPPADDGEHQPARTH